MKSFLISSPGRCGMHWVADVLCDLTGLKKTKTKRHEDFEIVPEGAIMLSHDPTVHVSDVQDHYLVVCVVRDPRDVVVSAAYYWMAKPPRDLRTLQIFWGVNQLPEDMTFDKMLALLKEKGHNPWWWDSYLATARYMPHHLIRYEDMWHVPIRAVRNALDYLGITRSQDAVVEAFERQRERRFGDRELGQEDVNDHYRKGIIGDWKNYFTEEDNHRFYQRWRPLMELLGYDEHPA